MFKAHDAILAVDIGGTNIRAGVVGLNLKKAADLSKACVWKFELWRHADEEEVSREDAVEKLAGMIEELIEQGRQGEACAGAVHRHRLPGYHQQGRLDRTWRAEPARQLGSSKFHLPRSLHEGDSEDRRRRHRRRHAQRRRGAGPERGSVHDRVERWGVLTIGTGLGNARFTNRTDE